MIGIGGQIPAVHEPSREPVLIIGMDATDAICVEADGRLRYYPMNELITSWFYDPEAGIWNDAQPSYEEVMARASQDDQPEDVPNELHDPDGAGDGDPAGGPDRGDVDPEEADGWGQFER